MKCKVFDRHSTKCLIFDRCVTHDPGFSWNTVDDQSMHPIHLCSFYDFLISYGVVNPEQPASQPKTNEIVWHTRLAGEGNITHYDRKKHIDKQNVDCMGNRSGACLGILLNILFVRPSENVFGLSRLAVRVGDLQIMQFNEFSWIGSNGTAPGPPKPRKSDKSKFALFGAV